MKKLTRIGKTAFATFPGHEAEDVPVKIDTGADASSIWASDIKIDDDGVLWFRLFDKQSSYYTGKLHRSEGYEVRLVRSSNGAAQIRYRVILSVRLAGRRIRGRFTLADRSKNTYPVLVGCRLLQNKFLVDVAKSEANLEKRSLERSLSYTEEMRQNPKAFFEKYHLKNPTGDVRL